MVSEREEIDLSIDEVKCHTTPLDAKTYLIDGIKGVAVTQSSVRLSFIENVLDTNAPPNSKSSVMGRHVVNIATDHSSFEAIMGLLNRVLADMQARENG